MRNVLFILNIALVGIAMPAFAGGHGGEEASSAGLPQFNPESFSSQIFWLIISFGILYLYLSFKALPALSNTIVSRQDQIQSDLELAKKLKVQAEETRLAYEKMLHELSDRSNKKIAKAQSAVKSKLYSTMAELREQAEHEVTALDKQIESDMKANLKTLHQEAETLSVDILNTLYSEINTKPLKTGKTRAA